MCPQAPSTGRHPSHHLGPRPLFGSNHPLLRPLGGQRTPCRREGVPIVRTSAQIVPPGSLQNLPVAGALYTVWRHDGWLWQLMACHWIPAMDTHTSAAQADHLVSIFSRQRCWGRYTRVVLPHGMVGAKLHRATRNPRSGFAAQVLH